MIPTSTGCALPALTSTGCALPALRRAALHPWLQSAAPSGLGLKRFGLLLDPHLSVNAVAGNRAAGGDLLRRLAEDSDETVRFHVAENPSAPPEVLRKLAADPSSTVANRAAEMIKRRGEPRD